MTEALPAYLERLARPLDLPAELPPPPPDYAPPSAELVEVPRAFAEGDLDADAVRIVRRLNEAGHKAYLVGGSVRDLLFGLKPKDFDVVTSAEPREMRRLFRNCRIIGRRFRLAHVFFRDKIIEVATFRAQNAPGGDENGELLIKDDNVFGTAEEDAVRRDFTVNALFYDVERRTILDYVGGVADAERKLIRTIGDPMVRMREDPIRMLRAVRLAARMGCQVEADTWRAVELCRGEILRAAAPRIGEDILRMFRGGAIAPAVDMMLASGILEVIVPELTAHLGARLRDEGPEEVEALRAALRVADARAQAGAPLTAAVQFAILLAPLLLTPRANADGKLRVPHADEALETLRPIAQRIAISKKDGERMRQVLATLPKLAPPKDGRKRRGALPLKRAFMPEAIDMFEVMAHATGDFREEAAKWRAALLEAYGGEAPVPEPPARRPAGGDRRRRGGPRRRGADQLPEPPDMPPTPAEPTE
ncbi:polynucleotide adenylyltransferase PcnB [bacterium]|nr:polynucleotide adenylyltransferase PcnB [bacterium]